jgi:hypothetical protein
MRFYFGRFTARPQPHVVFPDVRAVFGDRAQSHRKWLKPLLTVDLSQVRRDWVGHAHFCYFESAGNFVEFGVDNSTYRVLRGYRLERGPSGRKVDRSSVVQKFDEIFEAEGYEELLGADGESIRDPVPRFRKQRYVRFRGFELPKYKAVDDWFAVARNKLHARGFGPYRGQPERAPNPTSLMLRGRPFWLQSDETPLDPDGARMQFVGQVDASRFSNEIGGMIYLFHAPAHRLVTMVSQRT